MAVEVNNLWKTFRIPHERRDTLFENLVGFLRPNQYENYTVLRDVSFSVEEGECLGIIGDNGSGKSTLLKLIANILRPTKGTIKVDGRITPFLELGVGFQPDLTARENVGVYAAIMGLSNKVARERADGVLEFAGLHKFEDTKLKNLSSGMQVRLAFSTAIQTDPDVLLVDEVLAVGDMEFQQKCFDVFKRYRKEGVTILFVSHDLGAVRRFCDRTLLLGGGEKRAFGETGEILDRYIYGSEEATRMPEEFTPEKSAPERVASEQAQPNRWGSKKMAITSVKLLDKFGLEGDRFNSMDPLKIRIYYNAPEPVSNPLFGIALYNEDGVFCYGTNTEIKGVRLESIKGSGHVDLLIENLTMIQGRFLLTVAVHSKDNVHYDWLDKQYMFNVINTGRDVGLFNIPCHWVT